MGLKIIPDNNGGIYTGALLTEKTISRSEVEDFENKTGEKLDIALKFMDFKWGLDFPLSEAKIMTDRGGALFIKLESGSDYSLDDILAGKADKLLENFAKGAKDFGKEVFVSFDHEMNAYWYPWGQKPEKFIEAYRYVHDKIGSYGADNITWVWNPYVDFPMEPYYPGDEYVDWVALNGYNWEGGKSWEDIFGSDLTVLEKYRKSIMIGETASGTDDPSLITQLVDYVAGDKRIKAYVYFDINKEKPWAIDKPGEIEAYYEAMKKHHSLFLRSIQAINCDDKKISGKKSGSVQPSAESAILPSVEISGDLPISRIYGGKFDFNSGNLVRTADGFKFNADHAKDAGCGILCDNADINRRNTLEFKIKGEMTRHADYAKLVFYVYSDEDSDNKATIISDIEGLSTEFTTIRVDLEGKINKVKKIQFMLISDNGSCEVEIKDIIFK